MESKRPIPVISKITEPFWEAAKRYVLVMQKCSDCGYFNYPPRAICDQCTSRKLIYERVSGRGKVHSYTITHVARVPSFEDKTPYYNIVVELDEQPGLLMLTNLLHSDSKEVKVGRPVEVVFEKISDEITLPQFKLKRFNDGLEIPKGIPSTKS